jgi:hypothetical protein
LNIYNITLLITCLTFSACDSTEFASGTGKKSVSDTDSPTNASTDTPQTPEEISNDRITNGGDGGDVGTLNKSGFFDIQDGEMCTTMEIDDTKNKSDSNAKGTNIFFKNVGVDPGNSNYDPSSSHGHTPYTVSPSDTLSKTEFKFTNADLKNLLAGSINKIEWIVFAHQFHNGLDTIEIELSTVDGKLKSTLTPNIYSAYGIATIENIVPHGDGYKGDVLLSTFSYDPESGLPHNAAITAIGNVSSQVGTNFVGPASDKIAPDVSETGVDLSEFSLTINIGANTYDSIQYRTVEGYAWGDRHINKCD